jgi:chitin disaccharide deacetylase
MNDVLQTTARRRLIVNADDFGLSPGINRGILHAHEQGIVTSTSVMVRWPAAAASSSLVRSHPDLSLGLHVDLGEWIFRNGEWEELYRVLRPEDARQLAPVRAEVDRQLGVFRALAGRNPTHLDSHQHVHRDEPLRSVLLSLSSEMGIPLRHVDGRIRYCGDFYGQSGKGEPYPEGITVESLLRVLSGISSGVTELCCHPGADVDYVSQYQIERSLERDALCDRRVRAAIGRMGIELTSFRGVHD